MASIERLREQAIDRFWETIPSLWGTVRAHLRAQAAGQFDISVEQFHVLRYVRRGIGSISELAAARNISRPAISQAVDALVNKGLIKRVQNKQDRRYVELTLTDAGGRLLDEVFKEAREWMKERMGALSAAELEIVIHAMEVMRRMLG